MKQCLMRQVCLPDCVGLVPTLDTDSDGSQSSGYSASSITHMNNKNEIRMFENEI